MAAKIIEFPGNAKEPDKESVEGETRSRTRLSPSADLDLHLDRALRRLDKDDPIRNRLVQDAYSVTFSNVFRLLR